MTEEEGLLETVKAYEKVVAEIEDLQRRQFNLEQAIDSQCELMGIETREVSNSQLTRRTESTWHQSLLQPLLELLPEAGFVVEDFLTKARPAPARRWDMSKVKTLIKYGSELAKCIKSSETRDHRLRIRKVEE